MNKEIWRAMWFESMLELTSLDLQLKTWLDKENTNPHWSYSEFMCCYFDDVLWGGSTCGYGYPYFINEKWLSEQEYECIKEWHEALNAYKSPNGDDFDEGAILNDSKWCQIVKMGAEARNNLLTSY